MKFKVVHTCPIEGVDSGEKLLEPFDASLVKGMWLTEDEIIRNAEDADAVIGVVSLHPFTRRVLKALSRCRIVAGLGIGFNTTDLEAATEFGIVVTNVPDYCLDEVSGLAIAFMLALGHKIPQLDKAVRERQINLTMDRKAVKEIAHPIFECVTKPWYYWLWQDWHSHSAQGKGSRDERDCLRSVCLGAGHGEPRSEAS